MVLINCFYCLALGINCFVVNNVRVSQQKRFQSVDLVDQVVETDQEWRRSRYLSDEWNRLKNLCSKEIGEKIKRKEPVDGNSTLPDSLTDKLQKLTVDQIRALSVSQIKQLRLLIDHEMEKSYKLVENLEAVRFKALSQIGNLVHNSVPVSENEDDNEIVRTWGELEVRKKYSQWTWASWLTVMTVKEVVLSLVAVAIFSKVRWYFWSKL
ncbi:cytoplasmic,Serine--tRNA ligase [Trichinella spiralis]|uniref:Cytoplasmic,Serine--tRNA ligase n=1 Tax=Trichinella spiralis TaxID=6334 RepID=A0ABR3KI98_TRISP